MLVAPPVPSPPRASSSSTSSSDSRSILSSSTSRSTGGTGVGPKGNGSMFAVFRDDAGSSGNGAKEAGWEDFGTVKSRQRENNEEKKEWAGEVMPQKGATPKVGGFKLEVYRDEVRPSHLSCPHYLSATCTDAFPFFRFRPPPPPPPFPPPTAPQATQTSSPAPPARPPKPSSSAPTRSRTTPLRMWTFSRETRWRDWRSSPGLLLPRVRGGVGPRVGVGRRRRGNGRGTRGASRGLRRSGPPQARNPPPNPPLPQ